MGRHWGFVINQNVGKGLLLAAVSLFFLLQAPALTVGSLSHPGPGLFPVLVASLLLFLAVVMLARSRLIEPAPLDFRFRNIALVAGSLIAFALVSEFVNMLAGIVVMTSIASFASTDFSIPRTATIAAALCAMAFALKKLLGVQLPLY
ncbi:MAG: tripartite tricarboxylate transporter TctB family protein [Alphaproteobacteria bacterium]